jgi:PadR family transcriptional regulator PadR
MTATDKFSAIRKGLLEFALLKLIDAERVYVADLLRRLAGTPFATQEGTLYPLLSRMRREGLLDYEWRESDAGPPRQYYVLTTLGREELQELSQYWFLLNRTLEKLGNTSCAPSSPSA